MAPTGNVRSFIWNHFLKLEKGKAQCRICMETYSFSRGSTSNLKRHFKLKHRTTHG
uniref:BED-type domain-containing protein n=1 Tax=Anopheles dirus TaxID=7168 RepID=A0A182NWH4_9DIPT